MIGGVDFVVTGRVRPEDVHFVVEALAAAWPDCVVEAGDESWLRAPHRLGRLPAEGELFVYRDEAAKKAWDLDGAGPGRDETMVNVLWSASSITLVAGSRDGITARLASDALAALRVRWAGRSSTASTH
jgi:hypothetical protein